MQYIKLGKTGVKVSRICIGGWSFGNEFDWMLEYDQAKSIIRHALDCGINFFDTADIYSHGRSEEIVGESLKGYRDDVIIGSKVYFPMGTGPNASGLSRVHIYQAIEASLKRLQTDYIDLYHIHLWDYKTPIEETLQTLNVLITQNLVRYIGAGSMWTWQFAKALWTADQLGLERFVSMQNQYNLVYREEEREMIPLCQDQDIKIICWSPLAGGFLTGIYKRNQIHSTLRYRDTKMKRRYFQPNDFDVVERVEVLASDKGVQPAQIALAWLLHKEYVTAPIVGIEQIEYVDAAIEAIDIKLSSSEMNFLEELYKPHAQIGQGHDEKGQLR